MPAAAVSVVARRERVGVLVERDLDAPVGERALVDAAREQRDERVDGLLGASGGSVKAMRRTAARDPYRVVNRG